MPRPGGFTMIELLAVLTIAGVVLAVALPAVTRGDGARFEAALRTLAADLKSARGKAIASGRPVAVLLSADPPGWRLPNGQERSFPAGTQMVASGGAVRFYADGSAAALTLAVQLGDRRVVLAVDWLTGRVERGE